MDIKIRILLKAEYPLFEHCLYEAILPRRNKKASLLGHIAFRNLGIGTALIKEILLYLKQSEYPRASLSVQKENYAYKLYLTGV